MALVIHASMFWAFEGMAQCFGLEPSPLLGLAQFMNNFFCAFLFCGMFVAPNYVIWPFRLFTYITPLQATIDGCPFVPLSSSLVLADVAGTLCRCSGR
jgi:hypothetical protein